MVRVQQGQGRGWEGCAEVVRGAGCPIPWGQWARCPLGSSTLTYEVVLGEYDMSSAEGPEQRIPVAADDIFVHPKWNSFCVACG